MTNKHKYILICSINTVLAAVALALDFDSSAALLLGSNIVLVEAFFDTKMGVSYKVVAKLNPKKYRILTLVNYAWLWLTAACLLFGPYAWMPVIILFLCNVIAFHAILFYPLIDVQPFALSDYRAQAESFPSHTVCTPIGSARDAISAARHAWKSTYGKDLPKSSRRYDVCLDKAAGVWLLKMQGSTELHILIQKDGRVLSIW